VTEICYAVYAATSKCCVEIACVSLDFLKRAVGEVEYFNQQSPAFGRFGAGEVAGEDNAFKVEHLQVAQRHVARELFIAYQERLHQLLVPL